MRLSKAQIALHKDMLYLKPPVTWSDVQIEALRQKLVCWQNDRAHEGVLKAYPIKLAYDEVKAYFLNTLFEHKSMAHFHRDIADRIVLGTWLNDGILYPDQIEPTTRLQERNKAILTAAPGLGKTIMTIRALAPLYPRLTVIVAPVGLLNTWDQEIARFWLERRPKVEIWDKIGKVLPVGYPNDPLIILTTSDVIVGIVAQQINNDGMSLVDIFGNREEDGSAFLVLDESYRYKNRNAIRSGELQTFGAMFYNTWLLSGMPISKYIDDIWMQLHILYPHIFTSYWRFAARYCEIFDSQWGDQIVANKPGAIEQLKQELADILIEANYPEDIPGWEPMIVECLMGAQQTAIYEELKKTLAVEAKTLGSRKPLSIKNIINLTGRLLQVASNPALVEGTDVSSKADKVLEMLPTVKGGLPALIWVEHTLTAQMMRDKVNQLGYSAVTLTGATKPKDRAAIVKAFQDNQIDVLILNPGVGKYGYTLTQARSVYYLERNYDREKFYQSLYRVKRVTSKHPVKVFYMLATKPGKKKQTVDHIVHRLLIQSAEEAQVLTVGRLIGSL